MIITFVRQPSVGLDQLLPHRRLDIVIGTDLLEHFRQDVFTCLLVYDLVHLIKVIHTRAGDFKIFIWYVHIIRHESVHRDNAVTESYGIYPGQV